MTVEVCVGGDGSIIPPMFIIHRIKRNEKYMTEAPENSLFGFNKNGWMTGELFLEWFHHFIKYSHANINSRTLLLLDGHSTHIKNIELIDEAREIGNDILCFPPHTTHRLQPLDVSYMGPLKQAINKVLEAHIKHRNIVRLVDLVGIYNVASMTLGNYSIIKSGFNKTGILPFNRNAFNDIDFLPSLTSVNSTPTLFNEHVYTNEVLVVHSPRISLKRVDGEIHIVLGNYHLTIL